MIGPAELRDGCPRKAACDERHMTQVELALRWRISVRTLGRRRAAGTGPAWLRLNGRIRYRMEDVLAFERAQVRWPARHASEAAE